MIIEPENLKYPALYASEHGRIHQSWVLGSSLCAILLGLALPDLSITLQFWLVALPITIIGLSHGGADPLILEQLMRRQGKGIVLATTCYLIAAAGFVALIWWLPTLALVIFLVLSAWHFGYTDAGFTLKRSTPTLIFLSGSVSIIGPISGHPAQTGELFAWLIGADPKWFGGLLTQVGPALGGAWLCAFALIAYQNRKQMPARAIAELVLLSGVMVILPPLIAFAYYFCVVHSMRHFMVIAQKSADPTDTRHMVRFIVRKAAPATIAAIILAFLAWLLIMTLEPESNLVTEAVRVMFWSLAALTLPHAFVVALWWRHDAAV